MRFNRYALLTGNCKELKDKKLLDLRKKKIGKTEFCTMAKDALILAFEKGTNAKAGVMVQPIQKWTEFKSVLRQLEKPEAQQRFKTICIDTASIAYNLCEQYICNQAGVQKIGEIPYGGRICRTRK